LTLPATLLIDIQSSGSKIAFGAEVYPIPSELGGQKEAVAMTLCGLRASLSGFYDRNGMTVDSVIGMKGLFASKEQIRIGEICFLPRLTALRAMRDAGALLSIDRVLNGSNTHDTLIIFAANSTTNSVLMGRRFL
jgi:hypothetical protein